jgi:Right handed beta helix region
MIDVKKARFSLILVLLATSVFPFKLQVGPGKTYLKPSLAAAAAKNGDTVEIAPGLYEGDACTWSANNLTLRSPSMYAHLESKGAIAQGKAIWVVTGNNTLIENIEFSGAAISPDENAAGIRQEGANLILRHCYFHDNQNGILASDNSSSEITIENTEFAGNGFGDGYTHNMYINHVKSFTLRYCYTHHAKSGHNIKTRALRNQILCNRSLDGADGTASYELDMPNGGPAIIAGNVFQQGTATQNPTILSYGAEGLSNPGSTIQIVNNTFVNDKGGSGDNFIFLNAATPSARVINNLFVGAGNIIGGFKADSSNNVVTQAPGFSNRAAFDYRLTASSPAIDKGKEPGLLEGLSLLPVMQFIPPDMTQPRTLRGAPDAGAFEYDPIATKIRGGYQPLEAKSGNGLAALRMFRFGTDWIDGLGRMQPEPQDKAPLGLP